MSETVAAKTDALSTGDACVRLWLVSSDLRTMWTTAFFSAGTRLGSVLATTSLRRAGGGGRCLVCCGSVATSPLREASSTITNPFSRPQDGLEAVLSI